MPGARPGGDGEQHEGARPGTAPGIQDAPFEPGRAPLQLDRDPRFPGRRPGREPDRGTQELRMADGQGGFARGEPQVEAALGIGNTIGDVPFAQGLHSAHVPLNIFVILFLKNKILTSFSVFPAPLQSSPVPRSPEVAGSPGGWRPPSPVSRIALA